MRKKVLVIGAGVAGLSAGSYLQRNSYDTEIFEMHSQPGGVCTAWKRGDYTFDYCIHWLMGTKPDTGFDLLWDELGAFENHDGSSMRIRNFDEFTRMEVSGGEEVCFYADAGRFGAELKRVAPDDGKLIDELVADMEYIARFRVPVATEKQSFFKKTGFFLSNLGVFRRYLKHLRTPLGEYADRWKSKYAKEAFRAVIPPSWSLGSLTMGLAMQHTKAAGYPVGGSLQFAKNIERGYLNQGGRIRYRSKVDEILVKDNRAVGIRLENGDEVFGDYIVSAADGHSTLFDMLDGRYLTPRLKQVYESFPLFPSSVFVAIGVDKDLSHLPHSTFVRTDKPFVLPDESSHNHLSTTVYNFDPTLAPDGKTTVTVILHTWNDSYWQEFADNDRKAYNQLKTEIGERVLEAVDSRFPGLKEATEVIDVSTPYTVKRYTNNWRGSFEGFAPTPITLITRLPKSVPGLQNCHMIGQWTTPGGGIPTAALDGRNLAVDLCKKDKKKFNAKVV